MRYVLIHKDRANHKYVAKVAVNNGWRYFYSQEEYDAYMNRGQSNSNKKSDTQKTQPKDRWKPEAKKNQTSAKDLALHPVRSVKKFIGDSVRYDLELGSDAFKESWDRGKAFMAAFFS